MEIFRQNKPIHDTDGQENSVIETECDKNSLRIGSRKLGRTLKGAGVVARTSATADLRGIQLDLQTGLQIQSRIQ